MLYSSRGRRNVVGIRQKLIQLQVAGVISHNRCAHLPHPFLVLEQQLLPALSIFVVFLFSCLTQDLAMGKGTFIESSCVVKRRRRIVSACVSGRLRGCAAMELSLDLFDSGQNILLKRPINYRRK